MLMPSPFPGMDPYLEHPEFFPGLHDRLINQISDVLQASLFSPYFAEIASRGWLDESYSLQGQQLALEIYTNQGKLERVTAIEVLHLENKTPGEDSRRLYLNHQNELLQNRVNLVEIDLLRGGSHTTCVPRDQAVAQAGAFDYHVCVRKMDEADDRLVYPVRLEQRLPEIAVPLLPGDGEVVLDRQQLFDHCYDRGPYRVRSPYLGRAPVPPLSDEQTAWAEQFLREKGLIPVP
jgi:Protein of unknown function (DUF4058)